MNILRNLQKYIIFCLRTQFPHQINLIIYLMKSTAKQLATVSLNMDFNPYCISGCVNSVHTLVVKQQRRKVLVIWLVMYTVGHVLVVQKLVIGHNMLLYSSCMYNNWLYISDALYSSSYYWSYAKMVKIRVHKVRLVI